MHFPFQQYTAYRGMQCYFCSNSSLLYTLASGATITRQKKKLDEKYVSFVAQILFTEIEIFMYGSSISRSFEVHKT